MYTKDDIKQICLKNISEKTYTDIAEIHTSTNLRNFFISSGIDSLDWVELIMKIEEELGIRISGADETLFLQSNLSCMIDKIYEMYARENISKIQSGKTTQYNNAMSSDFSGLREKKDGTAFCKLLGQSCTAPSKLNQTNKTYCDFIKCQLYKNFLRLR